MQAEPGPAATGKGEQGERRSRRSPRWDALFVVSVLAVAGARFAILRRGGAPATIDAGNWLAFGDGLLGDAVRSSSIVYPPVVPLLTKASVTVFGLTDGVALVGAAASSVPAAGVYSVLRFAGMGAPALWPSLIVLAAASVGEAAAWGGFPQLIAIGLMLISLVAFDGLLDRWRTRDALTCGAAVMATLATSHLIGVALVVSMGLMGLLPRLPSRPPPPWGTRLGRLALVALPSVWLVPLYISLATAFVGRDTVTSSPNRLTWSNLLDKIEFLYREAPWLWRVLVVGAVLAPVLLWAVRRSVLWRFVVALVAATAFLAAMSRESRFLYLVTPAAALGLGMWIEALITRRGYPERPRASVVVAAAALSGVVGLQVVLGAALFDDQRSEYAVLTPGLVSGIEFARDATEADAVIAVTSLRDAPLGWWVEAIAHRRTVYGAPLAWLSFDDEVRRASFANELFAPPFPTVERLRMAQDAGIELILLPTRWTFFDAALVGELDSGAPGSVVRLNSDVVLLEPGGEKE
jgi:hypothetical protein